MPSYEPFKSDILDVRTILAALKLPNELILVILDFARYWYPQTYQVSEYKTLLDKRWSTDSSATMFYARMTAIPARDPGGEIRKVREIEFTVVSHGICKSTSL
jgi:hypothetical protein